MKKKLALILSTALVLAAVVCLFAFPASAADADYVDANTTAKEMWKATPAAKLATQVKIGGVAVNEGTGNLADLNAAWSGTYTLQKGVLTLKGNGNTLPANLTESNGAIWIVLDNINVAGAINFTTGAFKAPSADTAPEADLPTIVSSPIDGDKNLKANGVGGVISHGAGTNAIRSNCSIIIMGDIGIDMGTGASAAFGDRGLNGSRNDPNNKWHKVMIIATGRPSAIGCEAVANKNVIGFQNDAGTIIFDNAAPLTIVGRVFASTGKVIITNKADVSISFSGNTKGAIECNDFVMDSADAKLSITATNTSSWSGALTAYRTFVMDDGLININHTCSGQAMTGIAVGKDPGGVSDLATAKQKNISTANYNGGTINVTLKSTYAAGTNAGSRAIGLFANYCKEVNFNGTKVNMNIDAKLATNQTNTSIIGGSGAMIFTQHSVALNMNDGEFNLNGAKCDGALGMEHWGVMNINGGTYTGKAMAFLNNSTGSLEVYINPDKAYADEFECVDTFVGRKNMHYIQIANDLYLNKRTATTIYVTPPATENFALNTYTRKLSAANAAEMGMSSDAIVFNPYDPVYNMATVTLNGVKEDCRKINANGVVTYIVKGENTIKGAAGATNQLNSTNGMVITGDGTLNVLNAGNYSVCTHRSLIVEDKVKLNVESITGNALHVARSGNEDCQLVVRGDAVVDVAYVGTGVYIPGGGPIVQVTENGELSLRPMDGKSAGDALKLLLDRDNGTGNQYITLEVSGNGKLAVDPKCNVGARIYHAAYDDSTEDKKKSTAGQVLDATVVNAVAIFKDNAQASIVGQGQGLYLNVAKASDAGIGNATVTVQDNAVCLFESSDLSGAGTYASGLQLAADNALFNVTGGKATVIGHAYGWNRGALYMNYAKGNNQVKVTGGEVSIENYLTGEKVKEYGDIGNAITIVNAGSVLVGGNAKFDAYSEHNGTAWKNRAHAYFMSEGSTLTIEGDAVASFYAGGDSAASTAAGIHTKGGNIVVKDKAVLKCGLKGNNGTAALTFELESSLTTEGRAKVYLDGGEKGIGVRNYNKTSAGVIEVKGGVVTITGKTAVSSANVKPVINSAKMKAGADAASAKEVDKLAYNEKYVQLTGKNPVTSDANVAVFAIFALAAVASTAAVMLRKKSRG